MPIAPDGGGGAVFCKTEVVHNSLQISNTPKAEAEIVEYTSPVDFNGVGDHIIFAAELCKN